MRFPRGAKARLFLVPYAALKRRSSTVVHEANAGERPALLRNLSLLAHYGGVLGFDFVEHADFAGLAVGVFVDTEIFFRHFVDVGGGAVFGDFDYAAANFDIAVGIFRVHHTYRYARVAAY